MGHDVPMPRLRSILDSISWLFGRRPRAPEIGRGLPWSYLEGERAFDARVKARYPAGTPEERLVAELHGQGFALSRHPGFDGVTVADYVSSQFVFRTIWSVRWRANQGRVRDIWGVYGVRAP